MRIVTLELINRLKDRILNNSKLNNDCLEYNILNEGGYGVTQYVENGKKGSLLAHRVIMMHSINRIIHKDEIVMHTCDNPKCVNINHLKLGTHTTNQKDKFDKGRQAKGINNGRYTTGYNSKFNPVSKPKLDFEKLHGRSLTKEQVIQIKQRLLNKDYSKLTDLSKELNIDYQTIRDIKGGRAYANIN